MYKGKRARFTSDALGSIADVAKKVFMRYVNPTDLVRMQKTLDLSDVSDDKPCINRIMVPISARLDEEERIAEEERKKRLASVWSRGMIYSCMGEDCYPYDYDEDDEGIILNPKYLKKKNKKLYDGKGKSKRGSRGSKKKNGHALYGGYDEYDDYWENRKTMYENGEWSDEDDYEPAYKKIKFYPDITNELSVIEFDSLKAFSDFCDARGYVVGEADYSNLKNWGTIHCCLDPIDMEYGDFAIITDTSYGGLYWTVESDLPADVKSPEVIDVEAKTVTDI